MAPPVCVLVTILFYGEFCVACALMSPFQGRPEDFDTEAFAHITNNNLDALQHFGNISHPMFTRDDDLDSHEDLDSHIGELLASTTKPGSPGSY